MCFSMSPFNAVAIQNFLWKYLQLKIVKNNIFVRNIGPKRSTFYNNLPMLDTIKVHFGEVNAT